MRCKASEWRTEEGLIKIRGWARDGLTNEHIAEMMGIHRATLADWRNKYSDIDDALKKGKEVPDREIEEALFKKAKGFSVKVTKPIKVKKITYDKVTGKKLKEEEQIEYVEDEIYIAPDTTAMIFWLKNRKPECWRDKPEGNSEEQSEEAGVIEIPAVAEASDE